MSFPGCCIHNKTFLCVQLSRLHPPSDEAHCKQPGALVNGRVLFSNIPESRDLT